MIEPTLLQLGTVRLHVMARQKAPETFSFVEKVLVHGGSGESLNCGYGEGKPVALMSTDTLCSHMGVGT